MKDYQPEVLTLTVGQLQTNCYIPYDKKSQKGCIIDPGDDADYITRILTDKKIKPECIVATHGHFDHILAVSELQLAYDIPFVLNSKDIFLVINMQSSAGYFLGRKIDNPIPQVNRNLKEGDTLKMGISTFSVIETPGHTPGSICLFSRIMNVLICGDLLFAGGGVGRTDFSYSSPQDLQKSIDKVFKLPSNIIVYPGHGDSFQLGEEKKRREKY